MDKAVTARDEGLETAPARVFARPVTSPLDKALNTPIDMRPLGIFLLMFPMVAPTAEGLAALLGGSLGGMVYRVYTLWKVASYLVIVLMLVYKARTQGLSKFAGSICALALCCLLLISTYLTGELDLSSNLMTLAGMAAIFILADCLSGANFAMFVHAGYVWLTLVMLLNSACIYKYYPSGMYYSGYNLENPNYYLFGLDNMSFMYSLSGFSLGLMYRVAKGRIGFVLPIAYAYIFGAYIYAEAGTAMVVVLAAALLIVLYKASKLNYVNYLATLLLCGLAFLAICILNTLGLFNFLLDMIGKDATFTGRTKIWMAALISLKNDWLLGFGLSDSVMHVKLGMASGSTFISQLGHVHNVFLEYIFRGGVVGAALFVFLFLLPLRKMMKNSGSKLAQVMCALFILMWLTCMFEYRMNTFTFWLVPACFYHIDDLVKFAEDCREKRQ